mmetsp:Transcript_15125/g.45292  ORF Transcript_15125/g.45292 Transcript_15125/m.45292 type:complete len:200 (+) Transcript_15125:587-1186(+)
MITVGLLGSASAAEGSMPSSLASQAPSSSRLRPPRAGGAGSASPFGRGGTSTPLAVGASLSAGAAAAASSSAEGGLGAGGAPGRRGCSSARAGSGPPAAAARLGSCARGTASLWVFLEGFTGRRRVDVPSASAHGLSPVWSEVDGRARSPATARGVDGQGCRARGCSGLARTPWPVKEPITEDSRGAPAPVGSRHAACA